MAKEPILFIVVCGMPLMFAIVQTARAFGLHITEAEETAIYTLWTVVLGALARLCVVPVSSLPPGTLDKIEATKTANAGAKP